MVRKRKWDVDDSNANTESKQAKSDLKNELEAKETEPNTEDNVKESTKVDTEIAVEKNKPEEEEDTLPISLPNTTVAPSLSGESLFNQLGSEFLKSEPKKKAVDKEYVSEVIINDSRQRYHLTNTETLDQLFQQTGAVITPKGKYYPDKTLAVLEKEPLLTLHITSDSQEAVNKAASLVHDIMDNGPLKPPVPGINVVFIKGVEHYYAKIQTGIDTDDESFNPLEKIRGPNGSYIEHIEKATGAKLTCKGRGSGFIESHNGLEANEPIFVYILGDEIDQVQEAKKLCQDLVQTVRKDYMTHKARKQGLVNAPSHPQYTQEELDAYYSSPAYAEYYRQYMAYYQQFQTQ